MPNSSQTWKTGEKVLETGEYECLNCRQGGKASHVTLDEGNLFPYCAVCDLKDNTYRKLPRTK